MPIVCQHDGINLLLSLAPSAFTLCLLSVWGGIDGYIYREASTVAATEKLPQKQLDQVVSMARSSIALQNFIASVLNALISTLVVVATFPEWTERTVIAIILVAALLIFFIRWITKIISFRLYELADTLVPYSALSRRIYGKKRRGVTYAKLLTYHEVALVFTVAIVICVGYGLRCTWA